MCRTEIKSVYAAKMVLPSSDLPVISLPECRALLSGAQ